MADPPSLPDNLVKLDAWQRGDRGGGGGSGGGDGGGAAPGGGDDDLDLELARLERNDLGNAHRLLGRHGHDLRYVRERGWHIWTGSRWDPEGAEGSVRRRAHRTARGVRGEAKAVEADDPAAWGGSDAKKSRADALRGWAVESGESKRTNAMIQQVRPYVECGPQDLDADPLVLNLENGTLELSGACDQLRPHRREDLLSHLAPVAYDPDAICPRWDAFLAEVQPDPAIRRFLQRYVGYCLTGLTTEQVLVFNFGGGSNGKGVFVDTVAGVLGSYGITLPFASFLRDDRRRGSEATPDLARLPGRRFVRASEPEKGAQFSEALIKSVTGGEALTARHLNHGFFDFAATFKVMLSGNNKPLIRGTDHGIWRRMILVPWLVTIVQENVDPHLVSKLRGEWQGILNWALDGLRLWLERGLEVPDQVRAATDAYRSESDPVGRFVAACVERTPGVNTSASAMYDAYKQWCVVNAERVFSQTAFGKSLPERGFAKDGSSGRVFYLDCSLHDVPQTFDDSHPPPREDDD